MNKCFAVCGNHPKLSKTEWESLWATNIEEPINSVITFMFDGMLPESWVGGSLKRGSMVSEKDISDVFDHIQLLWIGDDHDGMQFKRAHSIKRFKYVPINKTDRDIVESGAELIRLDEHSETRWLVEYYHDIARPEKIEFEKPVSGMQIGMMPVKLVQMLLNMGTGKYVAKSEGGDQKSEGEGDEKALIPTGKTIYDPFCGFGTTWFVAQLSGHNFIWSDSNPTPTKQNLPWWNALFPSSKELHFTVFKHDVVQPFTQPFLKHVDAVVTEWRLGPIVNNQLTFTRKENEWRDIIGEIDEVYIGFLSNFYAVNPDATIVITYPQWTFWKQDMSRGFQRAAEKMGYEVENIWVYKRKKQFVGRRVIRLNKKSKE